MTTERERHIAVGQYLKDIVFAANDGIITTFAVVAGVVGAQLSPLIILIIGFASMIADGFSMATGNYLGTKSEKEFYKKEAAVERQEIEDVPDHERAEIKEILAKRGYAGEKLNQLVELISSNKSFWVDFMMHEELGLFAPESRRPIIHAVITFVSFIVAGTIPLIPYVVLGDGAPFFLAAIFTGAALFLIGALRKFFSNRSWLISGLEMLLIGGSAAAIAYFVGYLLSLIVG